VEAVHQASLRLLDEGGIVIHLAEARELLLGHGARARGDRLQLPPDLVETCLAGCPPRVRLRGRGQDVSLGDGDLHPHNLGGAREVLDRPGSRPRPATAEDVAGSARLLDALGEVHSVTPLYTPRDVPPERMAGVMFERTLRNTMKPVQAPGVQTAAEARLVAEIARVVLGDDPTTVIPVSPVSPLTFPDDGTSAILEIARQGQVLAPLPCPILGATAPVTIAGALAQQNAEVLAALCLAQLAAPGLPCVYHGRLSAMNMRTGDSMWGCPEVGLASAATVQLALRYRLPVNVYGLSTSVYSLDLQSGYERAVNALLPALAGADEISGVGEIAGGVASCPAQMVVDQEILHFVRHAVSGFPVDSDALAVDLHAQVMDEKRIFLASPHTRRHVRSGEVWLPERALQVADWEGWHEAGLPTLVGRCQADAERIMGEHEVPPLPVEQTQELEALLGRAWSTPERTA
jgi:trimethylamine--corrinoid protein Co-methyltransferase